MTAPTTVQSMAGATLAVSAVLPATFDSAGYAASSMVYTPIGEVEDYGDHGLTRTITKFTPVDTAIVAKRTGAKDYGEMNLKIGNVPSDEGQVILRAAVESNDPRAFKMTYPSGEVHYLSALVTSFVNVDGSVDNIQRVTVKLDLDKRPVIVPAA
jgi:Lambda phage tail tube protein, TTP